jgi:hypothetical protein
MLILGDENLTIVDYSTREDWYDPFDTLAGRL